MFKDDHVAIAYGMGITAEKVAEEWKVSREEQDAFAVAIAPEGHRRDRGRRIRFRNQPLRNHRTPADLAGNAVRAERRWSKPTKARARTPPWRGLGKLRPVFRNASSAARDRRQFLADPSDGAARCCWPCRTGDQDYGLTRWPAS